MMCQMRSGADECREKTREAILDNPDLPIDFVRDLLLAREEGKEIAIPFIPEGSRTGA